MSSDNSSIHSLPYRSSIELKGWLFKWANYIRGYQKRWFVLKDNKISYYRNPTETDHCRGSINLLSAMIHTEDNCTFVVANSDSQTFHLRATSDAERQKWINALEISKVNAIRQENEDDFMLDGMENHQVSQIQSLLKLLQSKLEIVSNQKDQILKQNALLQRNLNELEQTENSADIVLKIKEINERATIYRLNLSSMINANSDYFLCAQEYNKKLQKILLREFQARLSLEELVEQISKQQYNFEQKALAQNQNSLSRRDKSENEDNEEDDFYDAQDNIVSEFVVTFPGKAHRIHVAPLSPVVNNAQKSTSKSSDITKEKSCNKTKTHNTDEKNKVTNDSSNEEDNAADDGSDNEKLEIDIIARKSTAQESKIEPSNSEKLLEHEIIEKETEIMNINNGTLKSNIKQRRTRIPYRPNHSLNLWSIMKNCIGKELTKIPMPVNFNEPLSMLQRMTEEFEYADILHKAAKINDSLEQMVYVAVFSVTCYATTSNRTNKPFNPLLGETFECDRMDDLGWKCISEQVSHHPPMLAQYCEGRDWTCWREFAMNSKFRGKYLLITPVDITHLEFPSSGNHYTWSKVNTTVNNIIVGKLWVDNHGEMIITNHKTGDVCHLNFQAYSYFSRDIPKKVTGCVMDKDKTVKWVLNGTWDNKMEACKVLNPKQLNYSKPVIETGTPKLIWKRVLQPPEYEKMHNMTVLAVQLNEPEDGVAPTDSRHRPDQRLMEEGLWNEANNVKSKLEEKQRATRIKREEEAEKAAAEGKPYLSYEPNWFKKSKDPITEKHVYMFTNEYWQCKEKQDWSRCPDIYLDKNTSI